MSSRYALRTRTQDANPRAYHSERFPQTPRPGGAARAGGGEDGEKEIVRWSLSAEHCNPPGTGCPVVTLAPDIARAKLSVRKRTAELMKELRDGWVELMPGATPG